MRWIVMMMPDVAKSLSIRQGCGNNQSGSFHMHGLVQLVLIKDFSLQSTIEKEQRIRVVLSQLHILNGRLYS